MDLKFVFREETEATRASHHLHTSSASDRTPKRRKHLADQENSYTAVKLQGVFFNWASPEFAKCWPVSNQFQNIAKGTTDPRVEFIS